MERRVLGPWIALGALAFVLPACVCGSEERATAAPAVSATQRAATTDSSSPGAVVHSTPIEDELFVGNGVPFRASELERWVAEVESMTVRTPTDVAQPDQVGHTLMHKAAIAARTDLARRLIAMGADPNALSIFGYTPLDLINQGAGPKDGSGIDEFVEYLESVGGGYFYYGGEGGEWSIPKPQAKR